MHVAEERAEDPNRRPHVPERACELALLHDHVTVSPLLLAHDDVFTGEREELNLLLVFEVRVAEHGVDHAVEDAGSRVVAAACVGVRP